MLTQTWEVGGDTPTGQRCSWEEQRSENKQRCWGRRGRASSNQAVGLERGVPRADSRQATEAVGTFWSLGQPHWSCEILAKCYARGRNPGTSRAPSAGWALSFVSLLLSEGCPPSGFGWLEEAQHLLGQMSTQGPESDILEASQLDSIFKPGVGTKGKGLQTAVFCLFTNSDTHSTSTGTKATAEMGALWVSLGRPH